MLYQREQATVPYAVSTAAADDTFSPPRRFFVFNVLNVCSRRKLTVGNEPAPKAALLLTALISVRVVSGMNTAGDHRPHQASVVDVRTHLRLNRLQAKSARKSGRDWLRTGIFIWLNEDFPNEPFSSSTASRTVAGGFKTTSGANHANTGLEKSQVVVGDALFAEKMLFIRLVNAPYLGDNQ